MSNSDSQQQSTPQEVLTKLEQDFNAKVARLHETRDALSKQQELVISAQDDTIKALHALSFHKERFLASIIGQHQLQNRALQQSLNARSQLPVVPEERADNLEVASHSS